MTFTPRVYFITPVHQRFALTRACLAQRREMIDALPFEAQAVIVGNDDNLAAARDLGFLTREMPNDWVSSKFNGGYAAALDDGATHMMPVGSDSFLCPHAFDDIDWEERKAYGMVGLSAVSPTGEERIDLSIKYPAGFGVGMVYPAHAIRQGRGADPYKNAGIDTSTWARCGRGKVQIEFLRLLPQGYTNFFSPDTQITSWKSLRGTHLSRGRGTKDVWPALIERYGEERVSAVQQVYALHALGVFITGERPEPERAQRRNAEARARARGRAPARMSRAEVRRTTDPSFPSGNRKAMVRSRTSRPGRDRWGRQVGYDFEGILGPPDG